MGAAIKLLLMTLAHFSRQRNETHVADYLDLIGELVERGDAGIDELKALTQEIEAMVDEGRDPTDEERAAVRQRRQELSEAIQALGND